VERRQAPGPVHPAHNRVEIDPGRLIWDHSQAGDPVIERVAADDLEDGLEILRLRFRTGRPDTQVHMEGPTFEVAVESDERVIPVDDLLSLLPLTAEVVKACRGLFAAVT
jgi:hypothetical protein